MKPRYIRDLILHHAITRMPITTIRRIVAMTGLCALLAGTALAGGHPAFDFLGIPMNARSAAMAGTFVSMRNDPAILFANPGGLSTIEKPSASIGFVKHLLDVNAGYATFARRYDDLGTFSAGVIYLNAGSFDRTDKFATQLGTFTAGDIAVSVGYGNAVDNLHYGAAAKIIYEYIDSYHASGIALDAGVEYYLPKEDLSLGLSVLNLGTQLSSYGATKEDLPLDVTIGVSKKLEHLPLTVGLNFHKLNTEQDSFIKHLNAFSLGGEFQFSDAFRARLGYNNAMRQDLKIGSTAGLAGFAAGFGLTVKTIVVDYAFTSFGKIGALHRFSVGTTF